MISDSGHQPATRRLSSLTPRELEVLETISSGATNAEAARRLEISVHAIKFHLAEIYSRLGVANRTEAAVVYLQSTNGLLNGSRHDLQTGDL